MLATLTAAVVVGLPVSLAPLAVPGTAAAAPRLPRLLSGNYVLASSFKLRPRYVEMCGTTGCPFNAYGARRAYTGRIRWHWHYRYATAYVSYWVDDCLPNCAEGTFHRRYRGHLTAFRVRNGHFTRMNLRYRKGGRSHVRRMRLTTFPSPGGSRRIYGWIG